MAEDEAHVLIITLAISARSRVLLQKTQLHTECLKPFERNYTIKQRDLYCVALK